VDGDALGVNKEGPRLTFASGDFEIRGISIRSRGSESYLGEWKNLIDLDVSEIVRVDQKKGGAGPEWGAKRSLAVRQTPLWSRYGKKKSPSVAKELVGQPWGRRRRREQYLAEGRMEE